MTPWFTISSFFLAWNFKPKETWHAIRFEKDTRYYAMRLEKDLLDDWVIVVVNGRIQTKLGQIRTLAFPCFSDAFDHVCDMIGVRLKRGYRLKTWQSDDVSLLKFLPYASINTDLTTLKKPGNPRRMTTQKPPASPFPLQTLIQTTPKQMGFVF